MLSCSHSLRHLRSAVLKVFGFASKILALLAITAILAIPRLSWSQTCTSFIVVNAFDHKLHIDIQTLKPEDFEAKMGGTQLEIVSLDQDYNSRLLVLLEMDGVNNTKIHDTVDTAIHMV